jgi:hypothetical protein
MPTQHRVIAHPGGEPEAPERLYAGEARQRQHRGCCEHPCAGHDEEAGPQPPVDA